MNITRIAARLDKATSRIEGLLLAWSVLLLTALTVGNVVSRKFFHASWSFAEEISQLFLIVITFAGVGYAARRASHICMNAFFDALPDKIKKPLAVVIALGTSLLLFFLAWQAALYVHTTYTTAKTTPALQLPFYLFIIIVPIGLALGGIQYLLTVVKNLTHEGIWMSVHVTADQVHENQ